MRRVFLIAFGIGITVLIIGVLGLGAFPPKIVPHPVQKTVPNSSFAPK